MCSLDSDSGVCPSANLLISGSTFVSNGTMVCVFVCVCVCVCGGGMPAEHSHGSTISCALWILILESVHKQIYLLVGPYLSQMG